jgi:hypothetical protein
MIVGDDGKLKRSVPDALMSVLARIGRDTGTLLPDKSWVRKFCMPT